MYLSFELRKYFFFKQTGYEPFKQGRVKMIDQGKRDIGCYPILFCARLKAIFKVDSRVTGLELFGESVEFILGDLCQHNIIFGHP